MRHRRRLHTQTVRRKANTTSQTRFAAPKKKRSLKPLLYIFFILVLAAIIYFNFDLLKDLYINYTDSPRTGESISQTTTEAEKPAIPAKNNRQVQQYTPIEKKIQLEILNGCGESGVAKQLTNLLKDKKYDIVNSGNYIEKGNINWNVEETRIIDQLGTQENARVLADIMGVLYSNVESYENVSPIADLTIIIGKDYKTLAIFQ